MDKNTFWYNTASARDDDATADTKVREKSSSGILRSMNVNASQDESQTLNIAAKSYVVTDVKNKKDQNEKSLVNSTENNKFNY